ncbi:MAG: SDR family oxidoreductase [Magnetovibrio sp.]|nr:SDR family oxidoreductase [Magnetovibrio sp.]
MSTVMITGASRGLGLEFARQYALDGWRVIATCRQPDDALELAALEGCEVHALDVTDFTAVAQLAEKLAGTAIDILINNAGVYGPDKCSLDNIDYDAWQDVFKINALAPMCLAQCFSPHVIASEQKCIVTLSSKMGSMTENTSGGHYIYRSSKAAVNAVMKSLSHDLEQSNINVVVLHPGWVRTDMGGANGLIDSTASVSGMRKVIAGATASNSGGFFDYNGVQIDW